MTCVTLVKTDPAKLVNDSPFATVKPMTVLLTEAKVPANRSPARLVMLCVDLRQPRYVDDVFVS